MIMSCCQVGALLLTLVCRDYVVNGTAFVVLSSNYVSADGFKGARSQSAQCRSSQCNAKWKADAEWNRDQ